MAGTAPVSSIVAQKFYMTHLTVQPNLEITVGTCLTVLEYGPPLISSRSCSFTASLSKQMKEIVLNQPGGHQIPGILDGRASIGTVGTALDVLPDLWKVLLELLIPPGQDQVVFLRSVYKALHADHETGAADNKTG